MNEYDNKYIIIVIIVIMNVIIKTLQRTQTHNTRTAGSGKCIARTINNTHINHIKYVINDSMNDDKQERTTRTRHISLSLYIYIYVYSHIYIYIYIYIFVYLGQLGLEPRQPEEARDRGPRDGDHPQHYYYYY